MRRNGVKRYGITGANNNKKIQGAAYHARTRKLLICCSNVNSFTTENKYTYLFMELTIDTVDEVEIPHYFGHRMNDGRQLRFWKSEEATERRQDTTRKPCVNNRTESDDIFCSKLQWKHCKYKTINAVFDRATSTVFI